MPRSQHAFIEEFYRNESASVLANLIRLLGDFDLAEEALHEAFVVAAETWPRNGVPDNPRAWLISTGRFRAIDMLRKRSRFDQSKLAIAKRIEEIAAANDARRDEDIQDDRLRLIFTCCHPAIAPQNQIALTLREVCGLSSEAIAAAFLIPVATLAQRLVRGKSKIRDAGIPFELPTKENFRDRLDSVLAVVYLVFNEGYSASSGEALTRPDLSEEAIRLGRLLAELQPDPEVLGLLALMLLQESRREARASIDGDLILLEDQDRTKWNQAYIREGQVLVQRAMAQGMYGSYTLQASIAAEHAAAILARDTNWNNIVALYDQLLSIHSSPVVELNRSVAVVMRDGPRSGLALIDHLLKNGDLANYHLTHAARADLLRRCGETQTAITAYRRALELARQEPERRFLQRRIDEMNGD